MEFQDGGGIKVHNTFLDNVSKFLYITVTEANPVKDLD